MDRGAEKNAMPRGRRISVRSFFVHEENFPGAAGKCLPFGEKRGMYVLRMSEQDIYALACNGKSRLSPERRTCTDRREQVIMPASIIQGVCAACAASGSPVYL